MENPCPCLGTRYWTSAAFWEEMKWLLSRPLPQSETILSSSDKWWSCGDGKYSPFISQPSTIYVSIIEPLSRFPLFRDFHGSLSTSFFFFWYDINERLTDMIPPSHESSRWVISISIRLSGSVMKYKPHVAPSVISLELALYWKLPCFDVTVIQSASTSPKIFNFVKTFNNSIW